jgi:outer membrane immunogenic protein
LQTTGLLYTERNKMKNLFIATALTAAVVAAPAAARDFTGPRVEATVGFDDIRNGAEVTDVTYGAGIGYDRQFGRVVLGVDAVAANVFDRADLGAGARLGYVAKDNVMLFGRVGYTNLNAASAASNLEGVTVGGGVEANVAGPFYGKVEYRYTDFTGGNTARHAGLLAIGVRF